MNHPAVDALLKEVDTLLRVYRNPNLRDETVKRIREKLEALTLPKEPPPGLLQSMALRYRHDFGLEADDTSPMSCGLTDAERESILRTMRQLYEEVAGYGFYRP